MERTYGALFSRSGKKREDKGCLPHAPLIVGSFERNDSILAGIRGPVKRGHGTEISNLHPRPHRRYSPVPPETAAPGKGVLSP